MTFDDAIDRTGCIAMFEGKITIVVEKIPGNTFLFYGRMNNAFVHCDILSELQLKRAIRDFPTHEWHPCTIQVYRV